MLSGGVRDNRSGRLVAFPNQYEIVRDAGGNFFNMVANEKNRRLARASDAIDGLQNQPSIADIQALTWLIQNQQPWRFNHGSGK